MASIIMIVLFLGGVLGLIGVFGTLWQHRYRTPQRGLYLCAIAGSSLIALDYVLMGVYAPRPLHILEWLLLTLLAAATLLVARFYYRQYKKTFSA